MSARDIDPPAVEPWTIPRQPPASEKVRRRRGVASSSSIATSGIAAAAGAAPCSSVVDVLLYQDNRLPSPSPASGWNSEAPASARGSTSGSQ